MNKMHHMQHQTKAQALPKTNHQAWQIGLCAGLMLLTLLCVQQAHAQNNQKIVKWTDDKGVVHYGDVMPSQDSGRGNKVLNKDGVVLRENAGYSASNKAGEKVSNDQIRQDSALLASYSSIEEIDLALERNVQTEASNLQVLLQRKLDATTNLEKNQTLLAGYAKNNKKPPSYLVEDTRANQNKISKTDADIVAANNNITQMKTRFANYKTRYAALRPRNQSLTEINVSKKNLDELEDWKRQANEKLSYYLNETVKYKRAGTNPPNETVAGIQQANQEIARADQEIAAIKASIKDNQARFSSK